MNIDFFFRSITPKRDRRSRATFLSEEIIKKLIAESGLRTSLWIQNLYTIGRRVSELCDLKWSNITQESDDLAVATVKQKGELGYFPDTDEAVGTEPLCFSREGIRPAKPLRRLVCQK